MDNCDVLVLGGGPAGLSAAYTLKQNDVNALICDKNNTPGGLCRSFEIQGYTFDTFAHVNFCKDEYVMSMLEGKTECLTHVPEAFNYSSGTWIRNPVQNNLYSLDTEEKIRIIEGFVNRKVEDNPANYKEWLVSQYGNYFTEKYPSRYTRKYWTVEPEMLEPEWVKGRMYTPKLSEVLRGSFDNNTPNVHYSKSINYPKHGGFGSFLKPFDSGSFYGNRKLEKINISMKTAFFSDGTVVKYENIISTIPLIELINCMDDDVPLKIKKDSEKLDHTSAIAVSVGLNNKHKSPSLWFYIYDEYIHPARVYCPDIKSPYNVPDGCSALQAEIYYSRYKPLNKSPEEIGHETIMQMIEMGLFEKKNVVFTDVRIEKYANIMFTPSIYTARDSIIKYLNSIGVVCAGRFGEWDYLWLGQSILSGKKAAEKIVKKHFQT